MTDAMAAGRFPADEPLSELGRRQVDDLGELRADRACCGPELRVRQRLGWGRGLDGGKV